MAERETAGGWDLIVAPAVARAARPLVLSGDCPTAIGTVAGLQRRHRNVAMVWLDAHGDFNTPAITPVYLHLDIDVIDSAELPGLRFPSGSGPSITQIEACLAAVCAAADVKAVGIACAWVPDRVGDRAAREAITRLAGALGANLAWPVPGR